MSLETFYIDRIQQMKRGNMTAYEVVLNRIFGRFISWEELKDTERELQARVMIDLDEAIKLNESPFDVRKLARAIQSSRSGAGGCAMTEFKCLFCGEDDECLGCKFDISEYEEFNKAVEQPVWYGKNGEMIKWSESAYYPKDKSVKIYIGDDYYPGFEVIEENTALKDYRASGSKMSYVQWLEEQYNKSK